MRAVLLVVIMRVRNIVVMIMGSNDKGNRDSSNNSKSNRAIARNRRRQRRI